MPYFVGVDIGGSHAEGVRLDAQGRVCMKAYFPLPSKEKEPVMQEIAALIEKLCGSGGKNNGARVAGIGIGLPGAVKGGRLIHAPNMAFLDGTDFRRMLSRFSNNTVVENDVKCLAFGEMKRRGKKDLVALTLGTGVGGGITVAGMLYHGRAFAGELGHMTIMADGPLCSCGSRGCLEEYASARGAERLAVKYLRRKVSPEEMCALAKNGNEKAKEAWEEYGKYLGAGLANICYAFDPEVIVLGGGIAKAFPHFRASMREEMKKRLFIPAAPVVQAASLANPIGAAMLAMEKQA
jgi:glucokinase